jgi:hypothetical protein
MSERLFYIAFGIDPEDGEAESYFFRKLGSMLNHGLKTRVFPMRISVSVTPSSRTWLEFAFNDVSANVIATSVRTQVCIR